MNAITTHNPEPAMLGFLQRAVSDANFDTNKFEVVLAAVRAEQAKHAEREFYRAMSAAQGEMEPIRKDAVNPSTRSKYARFEAVDGHLRPIYTKHGFSVSYRTGTPSRPGAVRMICTVAHAAGHCVEAELEAGLDGSGAQGKSNKTDVQATGSTVSYLRRYILNMVFNVALASEDDDGEGARRPQQQHHYSRQPDRRDMDTTLRSDDIPDFDAPKPDGLRVDADRIKAWFVGAKTNADVDKVCAHNGVLAVRAKMETEQRHELIAELTAAENEARARITEATMGDAAEPEQAAA